MSKTTSFRTLVVAAGLASVLAVALAQAQTPPTSSTLIGRGTFENSFKVKRTGGNDWEVEVEAKGGLDVATQTILFPDGSQSGWHIHPGPVFIVVKEGRMTFYESDCSSTVVGAGHGFLDTGVDPHLARNESGSPATNVVTYFVPPGTTQLRTNTPAPLSCPL
jgi:quercetin dioxygenase-like cupin family protein